MAVVFALLTAVVYGIADYSGGRGSRLASSFTVTFVGQCAGFLGALLLALFIGDPVPSGHDLFISAAAGVAGSLGLLGFYRAMASGSMTIVAPITALVGTTIPVVWGLVDGERPGFISYVGMIVAVFAVVLVTDALGVQDKRTPLNIVVLAVIAGTCFATIFIAFDHVSSDAGLWPLVALRSVSLPIVFGVVLATRHPLRTKGEATRWALTSGILDSAANGFYLIAARHGLLSVVAVIASLYPVSTLVLATSLDKEKLHPAQWVGVGLALVALVLVSAG
ncbi:MAG: DMT family transporter [Acidobacteria bacterium]|nr:DMT family transporter [Acidobacteriota bacterium]